MLLISNMCRGQLVFGTYVGSLSIINLCLEIVNGHSLSTSLVDEKFLFMGIVFPS